MNGDNFFICELWEEKNTGQWNKKETWIRNCFQKTLNIKLSSFCWPFRKFSFCLRVFRFQFLIWLKNCIPKTLLMMMMISIFSPSKANKLRETNEEWNFSFNPPTHTQQLNKTNRNSFFGCPEFYVILLRDHGLTKSGKKITGIKIFLQLLFFWFVRKKSESDFVHWIYVKTRTNTSHTHTNKQKNK